MQKRKLYKYFEIILKKLKMNKLNIFQNAFLCELSTKILLGTKVLFKIYLKNYIKYVYKY